MRKALIALMQCVAECRSLTSTAAPSCAASSAAVALDTCASAKGQLEGRGLVQRSAVRSTSNHKGKRNGFVENSMNCR